MSCNTHKTTHNIHELAKAHLSGDYTVTRREFTDGDKRTVASHAYGPLPDEYMGEKLWLELGEIWIESVENDRVIHRSVYTWEPTDRVV